MSESEAQDALVSEKRRELMRLIREEPGLSISEAARRLDLYWTAVALHVDRLVSAGLVRSMRVGRRRILVPADAALDEAAFPEILCEPACARVAMAIVANPGMPVWELCELTGMTERAVYHHVKRLVDHGLARSAKPGSYAGLEPSPSLLIWAAGRYVSAP